MIYMFNKKNIAIYSFTPTRTHVYVRKVECLSDRIENIVIFELQTICYIIFLEYSWLFTGKTCDDVYVL